MYFAERLRQIREAKNLSQGDIEKRTGLLRCYISRVENGHTVPSLETLEKLARACEVKLYQLFYEVEETELRLADPLSAKTVNDWASHGKGSRLFAKLSRVLGRVNNKDRQLILHLAQKMNGRKPK